MPLATTTETLLTPEAVPPARKRRSFHVRYRRLIRAARILLVAAAVVGLPAICHFAYKAFYMASCSNETTDNWGGKYLTEMTSPDCNEGFMDVENAMRVDASIAMLGVGLVLSSVVCYRRARRYKPRAPIRPPRQQSASREPARST
jgi:hypothetical protein